MYNYVHVLCKQIKKDISKDLTAINHSWEPSEDTVKNIMFAAVQEIGVVASDED